MFNILHKAMMNLALRVEELSGSRSDFLKRAEAAVVVADHGIDRRKFLLYVGLGSAMVTTPSFFDFGSVSWTKQNDILIPDSIDDRLQLSVMKSTSPEGESILQILYADILRQMMDECILNEPQIWSRAS